MEMTKKPNFTAMYIVAAVFLCFLIVSIPYAIDLKEQSELRMSYYLQDATHQRTLALRTKINNDLHVLDKVGISIAELWDSEDDVRKALLAINHDHTFLRIGIADADGNAQLISRDGRTFSTSFAGAPFFEGALAGESTVSDIFWDEDSGKYAVGYTVPIRAEEGLLGVLSGLRADCALLDVLAPPITSQSGAFFIVDQDGTILAPDCDPSLGLAVGANLFAIADFSAEERAAFADALRAEQTGRYTLHIDGVKYFAAVEAIEINDWMLVSIIDHQAIDGYYNRMMTGIALILTVSALVALFLIHWQTHEARKTQTRLEMLAYVDPLTNGRNVTRFQIDAQRILEDNPRQKFAIWTFDTKNFTRINDLFGDEKGDRVLRRFCAILNAGAPDLAIMCRVGSDVFAGIRPYHEKREIVSWYWRVIDTIGRREVIPESQLRIDNVMGVYCTGDFEETISISEMISRASAARRQAKQQPGNKIVFFTAKMQADQKWFAALEAGGQNAVDNGEITFFLQPKVNIQDGYHAIGAEALARWNFPGYGWVSPAVFIPIFEKNGFIVSLDRYIFEQVCAWYAAFSREQDINMMPLHIAVNVSRLGFLQEDIVSYYVGIKEKYGIADGVLELEFTESLVQEDHAMFLSVVTALRQSGFTCAIDDFGAGYSSLNLLRSLPIDVLKLDAEFFRGEEERDKDKIVVESFIQMAKRLGIATVAEGVERVRQVSFLEAAGCDIIQGFVFSKPLATEAFETLLSDTHGLLKLQSHPPVQ